MGPAMGVRRRHFLASLALPITAAFVPVTAVEGVIGLDGTPVDPLAVPQGIRARVLVFTTTDCPISNRYAPELTRLSTHYVPKGVQFWVVYPVASDTPAVIRTHVGRFGLQLPVARDTRGALVKHTGVTVTPEVAVVSASGQVVYRGRIDDRYTDFGIDRPAPRSRDLNQALTQLLAGQPVVPASTRAVGCFLPDLLK
ncbi:MAG: redoxin domain-containing protein [Acidobacteria bacterium]|nr:redoxin domain-containing protein [Acidobacteriota bacterium]